MHIGSLDIGMMYVLCTEYSVQLLIPLFRCHSHREKEKGYG